MVNTQEYINKNFPKEERKNIKALDISGKDLEEHLDLKDFVNLERLDCYENRITSLDLTNNKNLIYLNPSSNPISELDLTNNKNLTEIHFSYGQTSSIDLSENKNLSFINFNNNLLENLDLTNNPDISTIHIYNNNLTSLEITNLKKLRMLACHMNPKLTGSLDLSNCPDLINLSCAFTGIEELKLDNPKLYLLYCQGSKITELDLSKTAIKKEDYGKNLRTDLSKEEIVFQDTQQGTKQLRKKKVFLGGTWNKDNDWRKERLIPQLKIDYFNPIVDDWTPEWQAEEMRQKKICDFVLYVITKEMSGVYSIAEVVEDSNKRPNRTIFCYLKEGFEESQVKSLKAVASLVEKNGAKVYTSLKEVVEYLNNAQQLVLSSNNNQVSQEITLNTNNQENIAQVEQSSKNWFIWNCCSGRN